MGLARWRFIVCEADGDEIGEVFGVRSSQTHLLFNGVPTCQLTIDLDNPMADAFMGSGANDRINRLLKAYRNGTRKFVGPLVSAEETADAQSATLNAAAAGPLWRLFRRLLGVTTAGFDLGSPVDLKPHAYLIEEAVKAANARGDTGIRLAAVDYTGQPTGYIARVHFKKVAELILELGPGTLGGPDIKITPDEPVADVDGLRIATMSAPATLGQDKPEVVFEYGTGRRNISGYRRPVSAEGLLNRAYAVPPGFPNAIAPDDGVIESNDNPSRVARGLMEDVVSTDQPVQALRSRLVDEHIRIRQEPREQILFTPTPNLLDDFGSAYDLGDSVTARAVRSGRLRFDALFRLYGVSFATDELAMETAEFTLVNEAG